MSTDMQADMVEKHKTLHNLGCRLNNRLGTIALAISVVADIAPPHKRGKYIGAALCGSVSPGFSQFDDQNGSHTEI
jgi:hypothetical protein